MKKKTLTEAFDIKPVHNRTSELTDYEIFKTVLSSVSDCCLCTSALSTLA